MPRAGLGCRGGIEYKISRLPPPSPLSWVNDIGRAIVGPQIPNIGAGRNSALPGLRGWEYIPIPCHSGDSVPKELLLVELERELHH